MQALSVHHLELICKLFFLLLQLVHCLLIPASGLGFQITGSSRDDSRLLEKSTIQGNCLKAERERGNSFRFNPSISRIWKCSNSMRVVTSGRHVPCACTVHQKQSVGHPLHCHKPGHYHKRTGELSWFEEAHSESHLSPVWLLGALSVSHLLVSPLMTQN